jgi:S1-C subfamily serine protease
MPVDAPPTVESLSDLINPSTDLVAQLGIFCIDLNGQLSAALATRSKTGILIASLLSGEPATSADLEQGDVIRMLNGKPITDTIHFRHDLAVLPKNSPAVLEIERNGTIQYVAFEIE